MPSSKNRGFTLVELLVVIAIIALLAGLLMPSFKRAVTLTKRAKCKKNVKEIANACQVYADAAREHRGTTGSALPVAEGISANWSDIATGNPQCMWLLVQYDYASPGLFACPALDDVSPGRASDGHFTNTTCGYSFISMVNRGPSDDLPVLTSANTLGSLVVVADLNPRFSSTGSLIPGVDAESNSTSHGQRDGQWEGQNVGRLDGSAEWLTKPQVVTGTNKVDWIYRSTASGGDSSGEAGGVNDVFLIP